jgi:hypothetical protein
VTLRSAASADQRLHSQTLTRAAPTIAVVAAIDVGVMIASFREAVTG